MQAGQPSSYRLYTQFVLIGAALGLYYGFTYRATTTPADYLRVAIWSALAAVITVIIRSWKKHLPFSKILLDFVKTFLLFGVFLVGLEFRKQIDAWGGKSSVIVYSTILGAFVGFIMGFQKKPGNPPVK